MLTPYFELSQTEDKLFVVIHAPYSNISDIELYTDGDDFRFYSSPYFLRLHLPGHVEDSDSPSIDYNAEKGQFTVELTKSTSGEEFKDLDLIAKFLSPKQNQRIQIKPEIQVLSSSTNTNEENDTDEDDGSFDSSDEWLIEQENPLLLSQSTVDFKQITYGFANTVNNLFNIVKDEFKEVFDVINVEDMLAYDRTKLREETEEKSFSDDYYLFDLMEPSPELTAALNYDVACSSDVTFTADELEKLKNLGNREYVLSKEESLIAYLSLVDILYGYAYDCRTTLGEPTVESAWTINKISATLSWLQRYNSGKEAVICCVRRALCYPLYRHWELSVKVLDDTANILKSGVRQVIRCLLKIHDLFNKSDPRYILNQLYITDYCIWLQNEKDVDKKLHKLFDVVSEVKEGLKKGDVNFDIDELEIAASSTLEDSLVQNLRTISISNKSDKSSDYSSETEESSETDGSSETSSDSELDSDDDIPTTTNGV